MTIGEYLARSRQARDLTVKEISQDLHIREEYLEALEQDNWDKLPGEVYGQGFLRSYAKYLDLDAEQLVQYRKRLHEKLAQASGTEEPPRRQDPLPSRRRTRVASPPSSPQRVGRSRPEVSSGPMESGRTVAGVALVLVLLFVAGFFLMNRHGGHPVAVTGHAATGSKTPARGKGKTRGKTKTPAKSNAGGTKKQHPHAKTSSTAPQPVVQMTAHNVAQGTASYQVSASPVTVSLSFQGKTWVEVWQNGATQNPYGTIYYAGQTLSVTGSSSVAVKLGTRAVLVKVDNQSVPLPDAPTYPVTLTFSHSS
ncbi:helix-turn-helix domain-containing protein [Sulfobacillus sp. DSM 109850]|uniref:Helix-turn-helix domain-containing protein n=2 Tax=Sulfobacillus harzensis TaxID=2729629 RepID=A0A7Y0Q1G5_9FIRM|nr:RodZ domain-containing protein [Sulfobacillus harzensis]NMP20806.1 helix-turn-helix domain-containing protein [Sulfobacillus harzensis]